MPQHTPTTWTLTLRARVEHHVQVQDVDRFPHFTAKRTALELVYLDGFSGLRSVPCVSRFSHLAPRINTVWAHQAAAEPREFSNNKGIARLTDTWQR